MYTRYTDETSKRKDNTERYNGDNRNKDSRNSNDNNGNRNEKNKNEREKEVINISTTKIENPFSDPSKLNIANNSLPKTISKKGVIIIDKYGNQKWGKGNDNADSKIIGIYIYLYIHMYMYMYIYVYIYI
jgi:hypothetical protein